MKDPDEGAGARVRARRTDEVIRDSTGSAVKWSRATILKEMPPGHADSPI
jgi:hypothetical protein